MPKDSGSHHEAPHCRALWGALGDGLDEMRSRADLWSAAWQPGINLCCFAHLQYLTTTQRPNPYSDFRHKKCLHLLISQVYLSFPPWANASPPHPVPEHTRIIPSLGQRKELNVLGVPGTSASHAGHALCPQDCNTSTMVGPRVQERVPAPASARWQLYLSSAIRSFWFPTVLNGRGWKGILFPIPVWTRQFLWPSDSVLPRGVVVWCPSSFRLPPLGTAAQLPLPLLSTVPCMRRSSWLCFCVNACLAGERKGPNLGSSHSTAICTNAVDSPIPSILHKCPQPQQKPPRSPFLPVMLGFSSTSFTYQGELSLLISKPLPTLVSLSLSLLSWVHPRLLLLPLPPVLYFSLFSHYSHCLG